MRETESGIRIPEYRGQESGARSGVEGWRYDVALDYQPRALALGTDIDYVLPRRGNRNGARPLSGLFAKGSQRCRIQQ
jgi:hypothetical protein